MNFEDVIRVAKPGQWIWRAGNPGRAFKQDWTWPLVERVPLMMQGHGDWKYSDVEPQIKTVWPYFGETGVELVGEEVRKMQELIRLEVMAEFARHIEVKSSPMALEMMVDNITERVTTTVTQYLREVKI